MQQGDEGGDEDDLKQRGADADAGRHAQQVDHGRHHHEAAADSKEGREQADQSADDKWRDGADIEPRVRKAQLERQSVNPIVLTGLTRRGMPPRTRALNGADALHQHQRADHAQEGHIAEGNDQRGLSKLAQKPEQKHACDRSDHAPGNEHGPHAEIDIAPAPLGERARDGRRDDLIGARGDGDSRRDPGEHQQRCEQKSAAHAEHAR